MRGCYSDRFGSEYSRRRGGKRQAPAHDVGQEGARRPARSVDASERLVTADAVERVDCEGERVGSRRQFDGKPRVGLMAAQPDAHLADGQRLAASPEPERPAQVSGDESRVAWGRRVDRLACRRFEGGVKTGLRRREVDRHERAGDPDVDGRRAWVVRLGLAGTEREREEEEACY